MISQNGKPAGSSPNGSSTSSQPHETMSSTQMKLCAILSPRETLNICPMTLKGVSPRGPKLDKPVPLGHTIER